MNWEGPNSWTLKVYPNPTSSHIQYDLGPEAGIQKVQTFNLQGQLVMETKVLKERISINPLNLQTPISS